MVLKRTKIPHLIVYAPDFSYHNLLLFIFVNIASVCPDFINVLTQKNTTIASSNPAEISPHNINNAMEYFIEPSVFLSDLRLVQMNDHLQYIPFLLKMSLHRIYTFFHQNLICCSPILHLSLQ